MKKGGLKYPFLEIRVRFQGGELFPFFGNQGFLPLGSGKSEEGEEEAWED